MLPFLAVKWPWIYRTYITNKRTGKVTILNSNNWFLVIIMIGVWFVGALYSTLVVALSSNNAFNVFNDRTDLIQWTVSTEDFALAVSNLIILILSFLIVIGSYTATIIFLYQKSKGKGWSLNWFFKKRYSLGIASAHFTSIKRMFLNIVVFTVTCLIMASFIGLPLFLRSHIDFLQRLHTVSFKMLMVLNEFLGIAAMQRSSTRLQIGLSNHIVDDFCK